MSWESELDTQRQPWLADHKVGDGVLFPGAGFVELALAAALSAQARDVLDVEELEILSPLLLSDQHSKMVRLHLLSDSGQLRVESRERGSDEEWNTHLRGRVIAQSRGLSLAIERLHCLRVCLILREKPTCKPPAQLVSITAQLFKRCNPVGSIRIR
nr:polyketide synthase dehydratase domain-containing protein [Nitrincola nitratireducens]